MKKILYVVPGLNPLFKDGASNRVDSFARCFHQNGYKVYIAALCYPKQYFGIMKNKKLLDSQYKWIIIPHYFLLSTSFLFLMLVPVKLFIFLLTIFHRYNFVLADYERGAELASWSKICTKLIVNYRGDSIDEMMMLKNFTDDSSAIFRLKKYLAKSVDYADYTICVSANLKNNIEEHTHKIVKKCFIFPCCADIDRFGQANKEPCGNEITIGYFGSLSKWQCIDEVIYLYRRLKEKDTRYHLIILTGSNWGQYKEQLDMAGDYQVESVSFKDMPQWIEKMDVSIALRQSRPLNIVSSPTKLSESLAAGVPVIVTKATGDYADVIVDGENGIVLDNLEITEEDIEIIHNFCLKIKQNKAVINQRCKIAVRDRTWNSYSRAFIKFIENN